MTPREEGRAEAEEIIRNMEDAIQESVSVRTLTQWKNRLEDELHFESQNRCDLLRVARLTKKQKFQGFLDVIEWALENTREGR